MNILTSIVFYKLCEAMNKTLLSVVVPVFNEEESFVNFYSELSSVLSSLKIFESYEIIVINDGSNDHSLEILRGISKKDLNVKVISFARNFGHEYASYAGIIHSSGDAVVLIDSDGQDPPELILDFEREYLNGYHVVYAQRAKRLGESFLKKVTSAAFYPVFKMLTKVDIPGNVGDFCLISRMVVDQLKMLKEKTLFIRGLIYWIGLPKKGIRFVRRKRQGGKSKYNYFKLMIFAVENIISFSTVPIYFMLVLSMITITFCCVGAAAAFFLHFAGMVRMTGWTSLIICTLFLFSITLFFMGVVGLYVGKIFQEVKARPAFFISEKINFGDYKENKNLCSGGE